MTGLLAIIFAAAGPFFFVGVDGFGKISLQPGLGSSAFAKKGGNGKGNGNGGGNGNGNGNGNANGNANGQGNANAGDPADGAEGGVGGDDFSDIPADRADRSVPPGKYKEDKGNLYDDVFAGPGKAHGHDKDKWGDDFGLVKKLDLSGLKEQWADYLDPATALQDASAEHDPVTGWEHDLDKGRGKQVHTEDPVPGAKGQKPEKEHGKSGKGHDKAGKEHKAPGKEKQALQQGDAQPPSPPAPTNPAPSTRRNPQSGEIDLSGISPGSYVQNEVLVSGLTADSTDRLRDLGFSIQPAYTQPGSSLSILTAPAGLDALSALALLRRELPAQQFYLNRLYRPYRLATQQPEEKAQPAEPARAGGAMGCAGDRCYGRLAIRWQDSLASCALGRRIGIIDTGADLDHPAFRGQDITQQSFVPEGKQASPNWHGTGVLGILAGRPDSGTPGLIPGAPFFVAGIFFADDAGEPVTDTVSLLRALDWMKASGVELVNMSFSGPQDELVRARIEKLRAQGLVFTAAAGNEGPAAPPTYPAAYPDVIAVTAVTKDLKIYPSANRGPHIDLAAPGVRIWTAFPQAREGFRSGTSFAVPFATAVLAIQPQAVLETSKDKILSHMDTVKLGAAGANPTYGRGLLQAPPTCSGGAQAAVSPRQPSGPQRQ